MGVWKNLMKRIKHGSMEKPNDKNKAWEYGKKPNEKNKTWEYEKN